MTEAIHGSDQIRHRGVATLSGDSIFDLIVIGGGINGAAIAREAALSGIGVLDTWVHPGSGMLTFVIALPMIFWLGRQSTPAAKAS